MELKQTITVQVPVTTVVANPDGTTTTHTDMRQEQQEVTLELPDPPKDATSINRADFDKANADKSATDRAMLDQVFDQMAGPGGKLDLSRLGDLTQQLAIEQASLDSQHTLDASKIVPPDPGASKDQIAVAKQANEAVLLQAEEAVAYLPPGSDQRKQAEAKVTDLRKQFKATYGDRSGAEVTDAQGKQGKLLQLDTVAGDVPGVQPTAVQATGTPTVVQEPQPDPTQPRPLSADAQAGQKLVEGHDDPHSWNGDQKRQVAAYLQETARNALVVQPPDFDARGKAEVLGDRVKALAEQSGDANFQKQASATDDTVHHLADLVGGDLGKFKDAMESAKSGGDFGLAADVMAALPPNDQNQALKAKAPALKALADLNLGDCDALNHLKDALKDDDNTYSDLQEALKATNPNDERSNKLFTAIALAAGASPTVGSQHPNFASALGALSQAKDPDVRAKLEQGLANGDDPIPNMSRAALSAKDPADFNAIQAAYKALSSDDRNKFHDELRKRLDGGHDNGNYQDDGKVENLAKVADLTDQPGMAQALRGLEKVSNGDLRHDLSNCLKDDDDSVHDLEKALSHASSPDDLKAVGYAAQLKGKDGDSFKNVDQLANVSPDVRKALVAASLAPHKEGGGPFGIGGPSDDDRNKAKHDAIQQALGSARSFDDYAAVARYGFDMGEGDLAKQAQDKAKATPEAQQRQDAYNQAHDDFLKAEDDFAKAPDAAGRQQVLDRMAKDHDAMGNDRKALETIYGGGINDRWNEVDADFKAAQDLQAHPDELQAMQQGLGAGPAPGDGQQDPQKALADLKTQLKASFPGDPHALTRDQFVQQALGFVQPKDVAQEKDLLGRLYDQANPGGKTPLDDAAAEKLMEGVVQEKVLEQGLAGSKLRAADQAKSFGDQTHKAEDGNFISKGVNWGINLFTGDEDHLDDATKQAQDEFGSQLPKDLDSYHRMMVDAGRNPIKLHAASMFLDGALSHAQDVATAYGDKKHDFQSTNKMVSGILADVVTAAITTLAVAAAPFTGGGSLVAVAGAVALGAAVGAGTNLATHAAFDNQFDFGKEGLRTAVSGAFIGASAGYGAYLSTWADGASAAGSALTSTGARVATYAGIGGTQGFSTGVATGISNGFQGNWALNLVEDTALGTATGAASGYASGVIAQGKVTSAVSDWMDAHGLPGANLVGNFGQTASGAGKQTGLVAGKKFLLKGTLGVAEALNLPTDPNVQTDANQQTQQIAQNLRDRHRREEQQPKA